MQDLLRSSLVGSCWRRDPMFIKAFTNSNSGFNLGAYSMTEKKRLSLQFINISTQQTAGNYKHIV